MISSLSGVIGEGGLVRDVSDRGLCTVSGGRTSFDKGLITPGGVWDVIWGLLTLGGGGGSCNRGCCEKLRDREGG